MTKYYINLGTEHDRIELRPNDVDIMNYDNNSGYAVYGIAFCDNGEVFREMYFKSQEDRDEFADLNDIDIVNDEWLYDVGTFSITCDNGGWSEDIPCRCDVLMGYCEA